MIRRAILPLIPALAAVLVVLLPSAMANAAATTGNMPWENSLNTLQAALTGSTAKFISIIAIFVAGIALIFGEDLGQFARRLLMIVIAIAFLVGASSFYASFSGGASF